MDDDGRVEIPPIIPTARRRDGEIKDEGTSRTARRMPKRHQRHLACRVLTPEVCGMPRGFTLASIAKLTYSSMYLGIAPHVVRLVSTLYSAAAVGSLYL